MTVEEQIESLLAEAEPLRLLADDDQAKAPLAGIVDKINALRAVQAGPGYVVEQVIEPDPEAPATEEGADALPKRRPGRPKKIPD